MAREGVLLFEGVKMGRSVKDNLEPEEYVVYADVIHGEFIEPFDKVIAIEASTSLLSGRPTKSHLKAIAEELPFSMPDLLPETLDNFLTKNQRPHRIGKLMGPRLNYVLVSTQEIKEIFRDQEGWDRFYQKYKAPGLLHFSRVGFDREKSQALLYVGHQQHWLVGSASYELRKKENEVWTLHQAGMGVIS